MMPPEPGWYPDPSGAAGSRYWDGHDWGAFVPPGGIETRSVADKRTRAWTAKASPVSIAQGISLVLFALIFGYFHADALPDVPTRRAHAPALVDTLWRTYFLTVLALCVAALILGVLALVRPESHPLYSVITGVSTVVAGLAGCLLGLLSVGNGDDMGTPIAYLFSGFSLACCGAVITALSVAVLARRRRAQREAVIGY